MRNFKIHLIAVNANLKVENYVLFSSFTEIHSLGGSLSDCSGDCSNEVGEVSGYEESLLEKTNKM